MIAVPPQFAESLQIPPQQAQKVCPAGITVGIRRGFGSKGVFTAQLAEGIRAPEPSALHHPAAFSTAGWESYLVPVNVFLGM